MSSIKENITNAFKKAHPELKLNYIMDYDSDWYVINATDPKIDSDDQIDPYYAANKQSGEIVNFIPTIDDETFYEAYEKRRL